ncbi:P-type conjugative transfer protein TrbG [Caulobacter sp. AP07]|uniref:P-type conjugative transfer protein TrbG n=1 Tax=Caulobacter sp. AP07 TaxID=1144304 RepID=UPI000271FC40|nr:P-type conjugative transfer protein TrbG [Caulobacter sp. AP07]EJL35440.1 P-type conjugative transfer protein TrbG [Caulobacter sp. AP07]
MSGPVPRSRLPVPALAAVLLLGLAPGPAPAAPDGPASAPKPAISPVAPIRAARGQQITPGEGTAAAARPARKPRRRLPPKRLRGEAAGPMATIALANAQARDWPTPASYVNSALYYDFEPGRLYTVHTSPRFLTTIALKPGEKLIAKAAGDTVRWVIGETTAGAGEAAQVVVFVKPIRPDLRTNLVLTTDQRTYLIDAVSNAGGVYTAVLSWNYPQDLAKAAAAERARLEAQQASVAFGDVAIDRLNFRYRIDPKDRRPPRWTPVRVFDDGAKTYIEFPADLATDQAPPLFLLGDKDRAELVNYRQSGTFYVVDRLIDRAELRIGEGRQSIVRITRQDGPR